MAVGKRPLEDADEGIQPPKRTKHSRGNRPYDLYRLSDELLLRTFSYLSLPTLCRCQRVSRRFSAIACDSQIWKELYYNRFVRPRAARLPGLKEPQTADSALYFSSKLSKWLDEDNLVRRGKETNWKRQYKLRDNWTRGKCEVSEIDVIEEPPSSTLLVRMQRGLLFTVDSVNGLRAWSARKQRRLLASIPPERLSATAAPSALAVDVTEKDGPATETCFRLAVGFTDGGFAKFMFDENDHVFHESYRHPPSSNGTVTAVAYASPYLLTMTSKQFLSLYRFPKNQDVQQPRLLHSLRSQLVRSPLSLCVRRSGASIIASIAYRVSTLFQGWTVGIQEIKISAAGELEETRLAIAASNEQTSGPLTPPRSPHRRSLGSPNGISDADMLHGSRATSVSYSHPYLLLSHADNTLTLHLVTSTSTSLSIGEGSRLWGHTSSVSGAHIGGRGKAVSVSAHGDELRVWELEGALSSLALRRRLSAGQLSVRVQSVRPPQSDADGLNSLSDAIAQRGTGMGLALKETQMEMDVMRGWVGFDEENVVALKEKGDGSQALVIYDFT